MTSHILVIPSWYDDGRGSGGGYFRDQALALKAAGYRVAILAPTIHTWRDLRTGRVPRGGLDRAAVEHDGVPIYRRSEFTALPRVPYRNSFVWTRCGIKLARRYMREHGAPDLVHAHCCLNAGVLALAIHRRFGIRFVVTEHSAGPLRARWWERDLVRRVIKRASRCIAVSPHLAGILQAHYPQSRWRYLPNVLGEAFLRTIPSAPAPDAERVFEFLCVARLSPEKGHALLLRSFAQAFRGSAMVRLRLVGDGPLLAQLEELSARLGVAHQVDFAGLLPAERVRAEMEAADAFVLASNGETFGVAVLEALACGLPVVSTASGGPDHLIGPDNGILVACGDTAALRDALCAMRERAWRYNRAAIRSTVISRYGPDAFTRQFAAIIT